MFLIISLFFIFNANAQTISSKELNGEWLIIFATEDACNLYVNLISSTQGITITNKGLDNKHTLSEWCKNFKFSNVKFADNTLSFTLLHNGFTGVTKATKTTNYKLKYGFFDAYGKNCFTSSDVDEDNLIIIRKKDWNDLMKD